MIASGLTIFNAFGFIYDKIIIPVLVVIISVLLIRVLINFNRYIVSKLKDDVHAK